MALDPGNSIRCHEKSGIYNNESRNQDSNKLNFITIYHNWGYQRKMQNHQVYIKGPFTFVKVIIPSPSLANACCEFF